MVLQLGSKLKVADNSGANWVNCVSILGKGVKKRATAGSVILVSVIKFKHRTKVKKRMLYLGLVISVCSWVVRKNGVVIKLFSNRLVIFNRQYKFLGTRVYGIALQEVGLLSIFNKKTRKFFQKIIIYMTAVI